MAKRVILIGTNFRGNRVGEYHQNTKISQDLVETLRNMHEANVGPKRLSEIYNLSIYTVKKILYFQRREQIPVRWKRVTIDE
jgi:hypothetical protein